MRKITFLFYALLFCCFGAAAQTVVTSLDKLLNDKMYAIRSKTNSNLYLYSNEDDDWLHSNLNKYANKPYNSNDPDFQFVFYKATVPTKAAATVKATEEYYVYSIGAKKFIGTAGSSTDKNADIPMTKNITNTIEIRELEGGDTDPYRFMLSTNKVSAMNATGSKGVQNWGRKDNGDSGYDETGVDGNLYSFVEIGSITEEIKKHIEDAIYNRSTVTINYIIGEEIYKTETQLYANGTNLSAVAINAPDYVEEIRKTIEGEGIENNGETADDIVIENDITINITYKEVLPFVKSESPDNATWYVVNIHNNTKYWKYYKENNNYNVQTPALTTLPKSKIADEYLWCFVGNVFEGFKIYNKAAQKTLCKIGEDFKLGDPDEGSPANNLYELKDATGTGNEGATGFASMSETGEHKYINSQVVSPTDNTQILKGWKNLDPGSSCTFIIPEIYAADAYLAQLAAPENAVGYNPAITKDMLDNIQLLDATNNVKNNPNNADYIAKLVELVNYLDKIDDSKNTLVPGGYYRIINADPRFKEHNKTVGFLYDPTTNTNNYMKWGIIKNDNVDAIVQIEKTGNDYFIKHCNKEQYMQGVRGAINTNKPTENGINFFELGGAQFNVTFINGTCHANGHSNGEGDNGSLSDSSGGINTPSAWYIVPATDIEVPMNPDGEGKYWASTYLPFDVSTEDATILIGKEVVGFYLTLEEEETLTAKTGAILYMERDENNADESSTVYCTLNIVDNSDAAATNPTVSSALRGTLIGESIGQGLQENYFVLGKGSNGVGLYHPDGDTLKANKAYYYTDGGLGVNGLRFSFGEVTGIDNAAAERNADMGAVYDLSGRRVAAPVSGIYVKDGKKIFVR